MTQATRTEPTVGTKQGTSVGSTFFNSLGLGKKEVSHETILNDALQSLTDAQTQLDDAHASIYAQINEHRDIATFHQLKATEAGESLSRLERVKSRIANLLS